MSRRHALHLLGGFALVGCENKPKKKLLDPNSLQPLRITAVSTWAASLARLVLGDRAVITTLLGSDQGPEHLKRSGRYEGQMLTGEIVLTCGLGWDAPLKASLDRATEENIVVIDTGAMVPEDKLLAGPDGKPDPRIWLDPSLWALSIAPLIDASKALRPGYEEVIEPYRHIAHYEIDTLLTQCRTAISALLTMDRAVGLAKTDLRYLARALGIELKTEPPLKLDSAFITDAETARKGLEALNLDILPPPGTQTSGHTENHDIGTYAGWVRHVVDMLTVCLRG